MYKAKFYQRLKDKTVQCRLCHHFCSIEDGDVGACQIRKNNKGSLYSLVYGHPVAQNVDPIEKKPLYHFYPGSFSYSIGTLGCNLACANCQNWDISQADAIENKNREADTVDPERIVEEALDNDCLSISYTYNEPTIFAEYALDIMKLARAQGLKNVWISNGFMTPDCLDEVLPYLDAINIDLKSLDDNFYEDNCRARTQPILDNLIRLSQEQVHMEITTLVIPTLSDDIVMLEKLAEFIATDLNDDTPWHISRFSPEISWKQQNLPATGDDAIYGAYEAGKRAGLKYIYVGNMPGDQKENTYCPACNEIAIRRMGYEIERLDKQGRCSHCDRSLDIIE